MGGCRCTYRNCTIRTDGKTHMFHYPVFEKVRCHQWLVNGHRLDFLNLKVSQLKNRVVCQHHFKEENFMNYKKDKLTFDAIPTEDGPFCDPSKYADPTYDAAKSYPNQIFLEDIENEVIFNDKKANFSLKYGDFLTNGELTDSSARYNSHIINLAKENSKLNIKSNSIHNTDNDITKTELFKPRFTRLSLPTKTVKKIQKPQPMLIVPPYTDLDHEMGVINIYQPDTTMNYPTNTYSFINTNNTSNIQQNNNVTTIKKEPKIKILSEEKIEGPIPVIGKLEKVSPSTTINIPDKIKDEPIIVRKSTNVTSTPKIHVLEVLDVTFDQQSNVDTSTINQAFIESRMNSSPPEQPKASKLKNKLTPERSAAIEKKRKFNMRMKDILGTCLDKLDDPVKTNEQTTPITSQTASKSLIKQPCVPVSAQMTKENMSSQEYTIAYLDERMKSMERLLLNKIEQNSQKIMDLTESFVNVNKQKEPIEKKNVNAQTSSNDEQYKRFLFQEISKYISQDSKSLIYEELFINKFAIGSSNSPQRKRRRKFI